MGSKDARRRLPHSQRKRRGRSLAFLGALALAPLLAACGGGTDEPEHPGKALYMRYCYACHHAGIAGAPKFGDGKAWRRRSSQGRDAMLANVVAGMAPGMPPRGACPACTDDALAAAIDYLAGGAE